MKPSDALSMHCAALRRPRRYAGNVGLAAFDPALRVGEVMGTLNQITDIAS